MKNLESTPSPSASPVDRPLLYVATDLEYFEAVESDRLADDFSFTVSGVSKIYRRLNADYYAWLYRQMKRAKKALDSGRLDPLAWHNLHSRLADIHKWAVSHIGLQELNSALESKNTNPYHPPASNRQTVESTSPNTSLASSLIYASHYYPPDEEGFHHQITDAALAQVMAIRDRAISLGWSEHALLSNVGRFRFPYGEGYGLVCFVGKNQKIGKVTKSHIEIIQPGGHSLNFYNPDIDHPWITREAVDAG